ncbi:hypothetical protein ACRRTK_018903 [Alexandromys fortis]
MLMPKKNRIAIYELLFKEGVMVAKKDVHMPKHPELADKNVPNLHVMKAMQSLKSRGYVKEQFAWRQFYWYLTNEGIQYIRDYLHLSPEIVPATLRRSRPETGRPRPKGPEGERPARFKEGRRTETPTEGVLCPLVLTRKQRPGLAQPRSSSLEEALVVDVVSHHMPPAVTLLPGENRTAVCEAIAGKPAAQIFWSPDGDHITKKESHSNGTVTVKSSYHWEKNNVSVVFCFVSHPTGNLTVSIELNQVTGVTITLRSLLTILYVKLSLLGIILLILGFAFFQKSNYFRIIYRAETKDINETNCKDRRITWASTSDQRPDLQIDAVALDHDGLYSCDIATPTGNFLRRHDLHVLVPPAVTLFPGENRAAVCEAIAGKPAAQIFWTPDGDHITKKESHSNGTVTVRSTYHWEQNNVSVVFCFVSHPTGNQTLSIELNQVTGVTITLRSLLTILYVKLSFLGIILLILGFAFFQKNNYFSLPAPDVFMVLRSHMAASSHAV